METLLDSGETWFLESFSQRPNGPLVIRVAEGVTASPAQSVDVAGQSLGPFMGIGVTSASRCVEIRFADPLGFFTHREDFDSLDPKLAWDDRGTYLRQVLASSLRGYAEVATGILGVWYGTLQQYFLWTEDQIFQVFCTSPPEVILVPGPPDTSIQRAETLYAPSVDR